jgi:hypothetical protein
MQNAHERFGRLEFVKHTKDTTTRVRVFLDRAIVDAPSDQRSQMSVHLISLIGGDSEVGALWAGISEGTPFQLQLPEVAPRAGSLGPEAQCFRGSIVVSNQRRPIRHLVAVSSELAKTKPGADREGTRTVLCDDDPVFVLYRVAARFGLPVVPDWAAWFMNELNTRKAIRRLLGLGCSPVLVSGNKATFLKWIGQALKAGSIRIPEKTGPVSWNLPPDFLARGQLETAPTPRLTA